MTPRVRNVVVGEAGRQVVTCVCGDTSHYVWWQEGSPPAATEHVSAFRVVVPDVWDPDWKLVL